MVDLLRAAAARVSRHGHSGNKAVELTDEDERLLADQYASAMGWDKTADERAADFKRATEGAPRVRRLAGPSRVA